MAPDPRKGFPELLNRPRSGRMFRHCYIYDATPLVVEDHQDEQEPARRGPDHEEVRRGDLSAHAQFLRTT